MTDDRLTRGAGGDADFVAFPCGGGTQSLGINGIEKDLVIAHEETGLEAGPGIRGEINVLVSPGSDTGVSNHEEIREVGSQKPVIPIAEDGIEKFIGEVNLVADP